MAEKWKTSDFSGLTAFEDQYIGGLINEMGLSDVLSPNDSLGLRKRKIVETLNESVEQKQAILRMLPYLLEWENKKVISGFLNNFVKKLADRFPNDGEIQTAFNEHYGGAALQSVLSILQAYDGNATSASSELKLVLFLYYYQDKSRIQYTFYPFKLEPKDLEPNHHSDQVHIINKSELTVDKIQQDFNKYIQERLKKYPADQKPTLSRLEVVTDGEIIAKYPLEAIKISDNSEIDSKHVVTVSEFLYRHYAFMHWSGIPKPTQNHTEPEEGNPITDNHTLFVCDDLSYLTKENSFRIWFSLFTSSNSAHVFQSLSDARWSGLPFLKKIQNLYFNIDLSQERVVLLYEDPGTYQDIAILFKQYNSQITQDAIL